MIAERIAAVAVGLAVPALVSGRATMAASCLIALAAFGIAPGLGAAIKAVRARGPLGAALGVLGAVWLAATILSFDPWASFQIWARMVVFVVAAAVLAQRLAAAAHAAALARRSLVVGALAAVLIALVGATAVPDVLAIVRGHAPGWSQGDAALAVKGFGSALACLMPVVLWAGLAERGLRLAALAFQPLAVAAMAVASSHAGLAGAALGLIVLAVARASGRWAAALVLGIVVIGAAGAILAGLGPLGPAFAAIDPHRQAIWTAALGYYPQAPLIGHGIDVVNRLPGADVVVPAFNQARIPSHPHDWAIEVLVETGALGLAALVVVLAVLALRLARLERRAGAAGLALMAAFWGSGLFNFSMWAAWWQGALLIPLALVWAAGRPDQGRPDQGRSEP